MPSRPPRRPPRRKTRLLCLRLEPPHNARQRIDLHLRIDRPAHGSFQLFRHAGHLFLQLHQPLVLLVPVVVVVCVVQRRGRRLGLLAAVILPWATSAAPLFLLLVAQARVGETLIDLAGGVGELFLGVLEVRF